MNIGPHHKEAAKHYANGSHEKAGHLPTSPMVTTCMLLAMRKKPQSITSKSRRARFQVNIPNERMLKAALDAAFTF
jgi:hypothetical protein